MVVYLNVPAKYESIDYEAGKTLEVTDDVGRFWIDHGSAGFVGFRCASCKTIVSGDTIAEAQKKYQGHRSKHGKEKLKKEREERTKRAKEEREAKKAKEKK